MQQTTSALICSIFYMLSMFRYAFSVFNLLFSISPLIYTQYSQHYLLHIFSYVNRLNCACYKIISFFLVTLNLFFFLMFYFYVRFTCLVAVCCLFVYFCNFLKGGCNLSRAQKRGRFKERCCNVSREGEKLHAVARAREYQKLFAIFRRDDNLSLCHFSFHSSLNNCQ
jgi:hypothetical protein